ncbi:hypothetical protein LK09_06060 [Microbacterium mangrovi]|uniref:DUF998 domain-containing protein n=1 Tax=Microbacterium mangrovi TaxID=1348253 RepID=A0A0B2A634_9MICO|nr:hypothetical protein [Microbacterium mangrovi]KHK98540.1 hypothetical protein LK09_06060 [Microbacterium mangrovi]
MQLTSTSTQRTYRYVRLGLVGAAVALGIAVVQVLVTVGPVPSISATFYTPARGIFVGVMFAITFALVALSGHSWEQVLLDLAALFAPVMAIVPTTVGAGEMPGVDPGCPGRCVPAAEVPAIAFGMTTLVIIAVLAIATAAVLAIVQHTISGVKALALAVAAVIVAGGEWWALADPAGFAQHAHLVAAVCFFTLLGLTAVVSAAAATRGWRVTYAIIAALIAIDLVWLAFVHAALWGETIALVLFLVFWLAQTIERWNEVDPGILPAR